MYKLVLVTVVTTLLLFSCGTDNKELIIGKWKEVGTGSSVTEYKADGTYFVTYDDGTTEEGKYRVDGVTLYTTEKGESEELPSELTTLDDENMVENVGGMFETKYKRMK
ncbi:MAG: hypothetical protein A3D31_15675 [Candidatus Fluviicola riflensis]|nr:MAG: hypothetical protein CHH17_00610 [Candidatus Fluviicola riflensis]OGS78399.1 MAG: hypothetical protein A3D31_15675 [Candidatus Fluviicola riflensis]OGS85465.1 MAG: hypothetical protein A2724_12610 [Fluviicola sp. RIFCSPHIGHO2_01_FULL_43_53]OGS87506.1 MAG: hypothetical protein A3E30_09030 [Fluviicola sp. RIFCSPHIGHO2_12_FULL_43_24]